jgi:hypothetical protein
MAIFTQDFCVGGCDFNPKILVRVSLGSLMVRLSYRVLQVFLNVFPVVGHWGKNSLWAWIIRAHDHVHGVQVF